MRIVAGCERLTAGFAFALLGCLPALLLAPGAAASTSSSPRVGYARISHACPAPRAGEASCFALVRRPVAASEAAKPGVHPFALDTGAATSGPAGGLTPAQLASAYGFDPAAGGTGQTLAIVDAFDDPDIESDLAAFDSQYGLAACTHADGCFTKVGQAGPAGPLPPADEEGWSVEISLDVETAHAACPNCKILLVEANSPEFVDLADAVDEAVKLGANEVSNSYGGPEGRSALAEAAYDHPGVVIAAASGDSGWDSWTLANEWVLGIPETAPLAQPRPNIPSSLPTVVSVGGTSLTLGAGGKRASETVWNGNLRLDAAEGEGATGGGCSVDFTAQPWQQDAPGYAAAGCGGNRLDADVSAVADPLTGFDIYDSYNCGPACESFLRGKRWLTIGGTSLSSPLVTAMYALAGGADGVEYPALTLYGHLGGEALYDVTQGGNGYCDDGGQACGIDAAVAELVSEFPEARGVKLDCEGTTACNAAPGFDGPSGVGAPSSIGLFEPLHPSGAIASPARVLAGAPATFAASGASDPYPGATLSYSWSWGDGTPPGSGSAPSHSFAAPGEYAVALTLTDSYGLKSSPIVAKVVVEEAPHSPVTGPPSHGVDSFKAASPPKPSVALDGGALQATAAGTVTVELSCPAGVTACEGTIALRTASAVAASARASVLTIASGRFKIAAGKRAAVKLRLSGRALRLLARRRSLRVRVQIAAHDPAGASSASVVTVLLRAAHRRR